MRCWAARKYPLPGHCRDVDGGKQKSGGINISRYLLSRYLLNRLPGRWLDQRTRKSQCCKLFAPEDWSFIGCIQSLTILLWSLFQIFWCPQWTRWKPKWKRKIVSQLLGRGAGPPCVLATSDLLPRCCPPLLAPCLHHRNRINKSEPRFILYQLPYNLSSVIVPLAVSRIKI